MGQLRTAIIGLNQSLSKVPGKLDKLKDDLGAHSDHIGQLGQTAQEGWHAIHVYLVARFQKEGTTLAASKDKTMKELLDPQLTTLGKGLEQWRKNLLTQVDQASRSFAQGVDELRLDVNAAADESRRLRGIAEKKKSKWLVSKEYKNKIKVYLGAIDDIDQKIDGQLKGMAKLKGLRFDEKWVNRWFSINAQMTVAEIEGMTSMDHQSVMKEYLKNQAESDKYIHQWRDEYKSMAVQISTMKKWIDEADEMDKVN